eukprot:765993-Pyramimonas_sp.AAC.2
MCLERQMKFGSQASVSGTNGSHISGEEGFSGKWASSTLSETNRCDNRPPPDPLLTPLLHNVGN